MDRWFTVLGYWKDNTPILVGVVRGAHPSTGAITEFNDGPWGVCLEADNDVQAGYAAVALMEATGQEPPLLDEDELLMNAVIGQLIDTGELTPDSGPKMITDPVAIEMLRMMFDKHAEPPNPPKEKQ